MQDPISTHVELHDATTAIQAGFTYYEAASNCERRDATTDQVKSASATEIGAPQDGDPPAGDAEAAFGRDGAGGPPESVPDTAAEGLSGPADQRPQQDSSEDIATQPSRFADADPLTALGYAVHEACNIFRKMDSDEHRALIDDLRVNGLVNPVVMDGELVVDGRNRLLACHAAGITPRFVQWRDIYQGPMTLIRWIWSINANRRHLSRVELAAAHLALEGLEDREKAQLAQAEGRRRGGEIAGRGRPKSYSSLANPPASNSPAPEGEQGPVAAETVALQTRTGHSTGRRDELATDYDLSQHQAKQLLAVEKSKPELLPEIAQGKMPLTEAARRARRPQKVKPKEPKAGSGPNTKQNAEKPDSGLEKLIRRAVQAVEKVLADVPEAKKEIFKAEVSSTIQNLA